jgi:hypothetical protein
MKVGATGSVTDLGGSGPGGVRSAGFYGLQESARRVAADAKSRASSGSRATLEGMGRGRRPSPASAAHGGRSTGVISATALLALATGSDETDAGALLEQRMREAETPSTDSALGALLGQAWSRDPLELARRLMPSYVVETPRRQRLHRPKLTEVIAARDWEDLVKSQYPALLSWGPRDWAIWLNVLIRGRVQVEPGQLQPGSAQPDSSLPVEQAAMTLFYV